jgi:hypothetical protein
MNIHIYSLKGLRKQNEDAHIVILNGDGKNKNLKNINIK